MKDTAGALAGLLQINNITGEIINIGTGEEITMKNLLEKIVELMKLNVKINYLDDRPADVPRLWVNPARFKKITNFNAVYSFEQGLIETIKYYTHLKSSKDLISEIKIKNWEK